MIKLFSSSTKKKMKLYLFFVFFVFFCYGNNNFITGKVLNNTRANFPILRRASDVRIFLQGQFYSHVSSDGSFRLRDFPNGSTMLLSFDCTGFQFPEYRVVVNSKGKVRVYLSDLQQALGDPSSSDFHPMELSLPLKVLPVRPVEYFNLRQGFDIWSLLMNPMVMMALLGVSMLILPRLVDPEAMKEAQETIQQTISSTTTTMTATASSSITSITNSIDEHRNNNN